MSKWLIEAGRWMADAEEDLKVAQDLLASCIMQQAVFIRSRLVKRLLNLAFTLWV